MEKDTRSPDNPPMDFVSMQVLELTGVAIALYPENVIALLQDFDIPVTAGISDEELTDKLIEAIAENNPRFNRELAILLIEKFLPDGYDNFDMGKIVETAKGALEGGEGGGGKIKVGGDLVTGIAGAVESIFSFASAGKQKKIAEQNAKAATLSGLMNYKTEKEKNKGKKKMMVAAAIAGFGVLAMLVLWFSSKQLQTPYTTGYVQQ